MSISAMSASVNIPLSSSDATASLASTNQISSPALSSGTSGDAFTVDLSAFVQSQGARDPAMASDALIKLKSDLSTEFNSISNMLPTEDGSTSGLGGLLSIMG